MKKNDEVNFKIIGSMRRKEFLTRITNTIKDFIVQEKFLIIQNPHEDAISGSLKSYIEKHFADIRLKIDTQYNLRFIDNEMLNKTAEFMIAELPLKKWPQNWEDGQDDVSKAILPDIIIHNRNSSDNNFVAIEVKKVINKNRQDREWDELKLKAMTSEQLNYQYGLFLDFDTSKDTTLCEITLFEASEITDKFIVK